MNFLPIATSVVAATAVVAGTAYVGIVWKAMNSRHDAPEVASTARK